MEHKCNSNCCSCYKAISQNLGFCQIHLGDIKTYNQALRIINQKCDIDECYDYPEVKV
jgi:hypothetical protein